MSYDILGYSNVQKTPIVCNGVFSDGRLIIRENSHDNFAFFRDWLYDCSGVGQRFLYKKDLCKNARAQILVNFEVYSTGAIFGCMPLEISYENDGLVITLIYDCYDIHNSIDGLHMELTFEYE
jgi:hypothetical protein